MPYELPNTTVALTVEKQRIAPGMIGASIPLSTPDPFNLPFTLPLMLFKSKRLKTYIMGLKAKDGLWKIRWKRTQIDSTPNMPDNRYISPYGPAPFPAPSEPEPTASHDSRQNLSQQTVSVAPTSPSGTVDGQLPPINQLLQIPDANNYTLPRPSGSDDGSNVSDWSEGEYPELKVTPQGKQSTANTMPYPQGSVSIASTPNTGAGAQTPSIVYTTARGTFNQRKHTFCGAELSALKYIPKASEGDPNPGTQIMYSISYLLPVGRRVHGKAKVTRKTPLKNMDEDDKVLLADDPQAREMKRQDRYERLKKTTLCTVHFPNWEGATSSADRQMSREKVARELSKLVVWEFDEC